MTDWRRGFTEEQIQTMRRQLAKRWRQKLDMVMDIEAVWALQQERGLEERMMGDDKKFSELVLAERDKMKEPWIAKTSGVDGDRFEIHLGGSVYVFSLQEGEVIARDILLLLGIGVAQLEEELADFRARRDERFQMYEDCKAENKALKREKERATNNALEFGDSIIALLTAGEQDDEVS